MFHSRLVVFLRIVLPLAAIVLLSTLFLFGGNHEPGSSLPYGDYSPEKLKDRPAVGSPTYAGVASDGTEITMKAASANPGKDDGDTTINQLDLTLRHPDGLTTNVVADNGEMEGDLIHLRKDVKATTSTGWTAISQQFDANTVDGSLISPDAVEVDAPFGKLNAGSMELRELPDGSGQRILDLKGGVRMIYQP